MAYQAPYASPSAARWSRPPSVWKSPKSKPLDLLFKGIACAVHDLPNNPGLDLDHLLATHRGDDDYELLHGITKAATQPASTVVAGWASELVGVTVSQFVSSLKPSAFAQLSAEALQLGSPAGGLRVPSRSATPTIHGSFIGEGQPIPARRFGLVSKTLLPHKIGVISEFSKEITKQSPLDIQRIIENEILNDSRTAVDAVLLDNVAQDAIRPHGLRYNQLTGAVIPGLTPSVATNLVEKIAADLKGLIVAVQPANRIALIVNPAQAASIALALPFENAAITTIVTASQTAGQVLALDLDAFVAASGLPEFLVSESASFHEEDATPLPLVGGTAQPPVIGSVAAPVRNMFQTATIAVRLIWPCTWTVRRTGAVAWMANVTW